MTLTPAFDAEITDYTVRTSNNTNKVTAVAAENDAVITVTVNGVEVPNGTAAAWNDGENILRITISGAGGSRAYTVAVTKA